MRERTPEQRYIDEHRHKQFRLSAFLQTQQLDGDAHMVVNLRMLSRAVLDAEMHRALNAFAEPMTLDAFRKRSRLRFPVRAAELFHRYGFIVLADTDERPSTFRRVTSDLPEIHDVGYAANTRIGDRKRFAGNQETPLRVAMYGGCLARQTADMLVELAPEYGFAAKVALHGPLVTTYDAKADIVLFQPRFEWLLRLWDDFGLISDAERRRRLVIAKRGISETLAPLLAPRPDHQLVLVQGMAGIQDPPHGRGDFRLKWHAERVIFEMNEHVRNAIAGLKHCLYVDEERLFSNYGRSRLLDDTITPYSHHGALDAVCGTEPTNPTRAQTFGVRPAWDGQRLLAQECLDAYVMWRGIGRIKCVVVDLDNTLWPGVITEQGFARDDGSEIDYDTLEQSFVNGFYGGINQALAIIKTRGVMLASCSRNTEDFVLPAWTRHHATWKGRLLGPDDFVMHQINWGRKSESIAKIAETIGIGLDSILFIDDHPVERAEIAAAHPKVRVLGANMLEVRRTLLTDPCLQTNGETTEAKQRTDMVRAQLQRDRARSEAKDEASFLRELDVRLSVVQVDDSASLDRVVELLQRTNQFNTTQKRYGIEAVRKLVRSGAVYTLDVTDRFTAYGVVGVCVLANGSVDAFVLSCRVIALGVAVPFLISALTHAEADRAGIKGRIHPTDRNQPCRTLFHDAGFKKTAAEVWTHAPGKALPKIDAAVYSVTVTSPRPARSRSPRPRQRQRSRPFARK